MRSKRSASARRGTCFHPPFLPPCRGRGALRGRSAWSRWAYAALSQNNQVVVFLPLLLIVALPAWYKLGDYLGPSRILAEKSQRTKEEREALAEFVSKMPWEEHHSDEVMIKQFQDQKQKLEKLLEMSAPPADFLRFPRREKLQSENYSIYGVPKFVLAVNWQARHVYFVPVFPR